MSRKILALPLALLGIGGLALVFSESVFQSKHNLSFSGPGPVTAATEAEVCLFCHAPHNAGAEAPLWNRFSSGAVYQPYTSSSALAAVGQPSGASKLCLSCHDGTVALGMVRSRSEEIAFPTGRTLPSGGSNLGTDLSDDHPVSFTFDRQLYLQHGELADPALLTGPVRLDRSGQLQCTSCHDPHDNRYGQFLVAPNRDSALCTSCHSPEGWGAAAHRSSPAAWNGLPPDPWPRSEESTVSANACESCHRPHQAQAPQRLLSSSLSEGGCLSCHNGNVAAGSIAADLGKLSVHPVAATELHDPTEDPVNPPRHVECVDCHNPHAATAGGSAAPYASGALKGVAGVGAAGNPVAEVGFEYELCFRCHADSTARGAPLVARQFNQTNTRLEFGASSRSTHAVVVPGTNPGVPSLVSPYTPSSILSCTDCHNSNSAPASGGAGPNGPHGSLYRPILARQFAFADGSTESAANYALCYQCHSRTVILANTGFKQHKKHLDARASCSTCHDPHGVENAPHLINFNTQVVTPSSGGRLEFLETGANKGSCYLSCHGKNHNPLNY